jgi:hypothetical protein
MSNQPPHISIFEKMFGFVGRLHADALADDARDRRRHARNLWSS